MEGVGTPGLTHYFDLPAGDAALAQHTHAIVVERIPFSPGIASLKDREFFFGKEHGKGPPLIRKKRPLRIGPRADAVIGKSLTAQPKNHLSLRLFPGRVASGFPLRIDKPRGG